MGCNHQNDTVDGRFAGGDASPAKLCSALLARPSWQDLDGSCMRKGHAFELYTSTSHKTLELKEEINSLLNNMNRQRSDFGNKARVFRITPY